MTEDGNEGQSLELQRKVQAFIDEQKSIIELAKKRKLPTMAFKGYDVELNEETGSYTVKFSRTNVVISKEDKDGTFTIYPDAIDQFNMLVEQAEAQEVETLDKPEGLVESEELKKFLEQQKERSNPGKEEIEPERVKSDEEEVKDETRSDDNSNSEQPEQARGNRRVEIPLDTKLGEHDTVGSKFRHLFPEEIKSPTKLVMESDPHDSQNNFIFVVGADGKRAKINTNYDLTGKNSLNEDVLLYDKTSGKVEKKHPIQIVRSVDSHGREFGLAIFLDQGNGKLTVSSLARTTGGKDGKPSYYGQILANNGDKQQVAGEIHGVREATDNNTAEMLQGDGENSMARAIDKLSDKDVPAEINPGSDGLDFNEVEHIQETRNKMIRTIRDYFEISEESAQYMVDQLMGENDKSFHDIYEETMELEQQRNPDSEESTKSGRAEGGRVPGPSDPYGRYGF